MAPPPVRLRVAGLTHRPGYPMTILNLAEKVEADQADGIREAGDWSDLERSGGAITGPRVVLVRDPKNEHDPNAVEVHIPDLGRRQFVGYVPAERAVGLAPRLDAGEDYVAFVSAVPIDPDYIDHPGLEIEIRLTGAKHLSECALMNDQAHLGCTCRDTSPDWTT